MSALEEPSSPSRANGRKQPAGRNLAAQEREGREGPSDDAVRLLRMAWAAETAKTPPPRAPEHQRGARCHVPAAGPFEFRVPAAGAKVDMLRDRTLTDFCGRGERHLTTRHLHSASTCLSRCRHGRGRVDPPKRVSPPGPEH